MPAPLSVFISYAREDEGDMEKLSKHLRSLEREGLITGWQDRRISAGGDWEQEINHALEAADIILLLVSADFVGSEYCVSREAARAVERWRENKARVVPVILRSVDWKSLPLGHGTSVTSLGLLNALPRDGVPVRLWRDEDEAFENVTAGLRQVITQIVRQRDAGAGVVPAGAPDVRMEAPPAPAPAPAAASAPVGRDAVQVAVDRLAPFLENDSVTWFLGPRATSMTADASLRTCHIARSMLAELQLVDPEWRRLLPPVDVAASYYAAKNGLTTLVQDVTQWIARATAAIPAVHQGIASVVALNQALVRENDARALRPSKRNPQLIVTTSLDLMMERALVAGGVPFTRLVQYHSEPRIEVSEYRGLVRLDQGRIGLRADDGRLVAQAGPGDVAGIDMLLAQVPPRTVVLEPLAAAHNSNQNPLESLSLKELAAPIVYKLCGSADVPDSCAVSTEQYLDFCLNMASHFVPTQIGTIVQQTPGVFLGFGYLDPDFRLVYYTFLKALTELHKEDRPLYSVQVAPMHEPDDNYRHMELPIWEYLKDSGPRRAKIRTVEESCEGFLERLVRRVDPAGDDRRSPLATDAPGVQRNVRV